MGNSSTRNTYGIENEALSEESGGNEGQQPFIAVPADHQNVSKVKYLKYTLTIYVLLYVAGPKSSVELYDTSTHRHKGTQLPTRKTNQ